MPDQNQTKKRTVVVFSGAGLSAESGIPTFRDSNRQNKNAASRRRLRDRRQDLLQLAEVGGFDQVVIEPPFLRTLPV